MNTELNTVNSIMKQPNMDINTMYNVHSALLCKIQGICDIVDISLNCDYKKYKNDLESTHNGTEIIDTDTEFRKQILTYYKLDYNTALVDAYGNDDYFKDISDKAVLIYSDLIKIIKTFDDILFNKNVYTLFDELQDIIIEPMKVLLELTGSLKDAKSKQDLCCMMMHSYNTFDYFTQLIHIYMNLYSIFDGEIKSEEVEKQYKQIVSIIDKLKNSKNE